MGPQDYLNIGMSYFQQGLAFVRDGISKIINFTGLDGSLWTMILMLIVSIVLARLILKRYVTNPFSGVYFLWTMLIAFLIFILLMYL